MTTPTPSLADKIEAAEDPLGYWCQACRETGALHCAEVEHCIATGDMARLPYSERAARYAALTQVDALRDQLGPKFKHLAEGVAAALRAQQEQTP